MKKFFKNSKGLTLIELLAVIAIIAILFVLLIPQIDSAIQKSRQSGVQTDFHSYQIATESYLRQTAGAKVEQEGLESYLDSPLRLKEGVVTPDATTGIIKGTSSEKDPWGKAYEVTIDPKQKKISVKSDGTEGKPLEVHTYVFDGTVFSCTKGFSGTNAGIETLVFGRFTPFLEVRIPP